MREIDTDEVFCVCLESDGQIEAARRIITKNSEIAELTKQRSALLAACEKARAAYDHNVHAADIVCALEAALPSIEAAICAALPAPAKGGE